MIVSFTATGTELSDALDERFGRASYLILVNQDTNDVKVLDNRDHENAPNAAGPKTADRLASESVQAVVTGNIGPKASRALKIAGIKVFLSGPGTIQEALDRFGRGELKEE